MNDTQSQSALREWRTLVTRPVTWVVMASIAALLTIIGPFETLTRLSLAPRFAYWLAMVVLTYSVGFAANAIVRRWVSGQNVVIRVLSVGLATGLGITPVVTALNYLTFGYIPGPDDWPLILVQFFATALIVTIIFEVLTPPASEATEQRPPALLDRLPLEKRGPLLSLSSEDHYTRIRTAKGEEMVLIRLADAIREAAPTPGLQVHRSHWIALAAVNAARRDGDRAIVTLSDTSEIPVSRANVPAIKEAGLLPR
ncbi:LytTR family DNA-binding domain-containing protein [Gymnodinialimonas hymeniacidonis]|uniref:LytTR family DNA-binding domain-containing protein n=1 Tax=Gymnodinialimonas hymeniacidonis TaxID=3126508 RepID=UPI0034C6AFF7